MEKKTIAWLLILAALLLVGEKLSLAAENAERPYYPNSAHQIVIKKEEKSNYAALAKSVGFDINARYSYTEYADIKTKNKLGTAGAYEFLILSTGGTEDDWNSWQKFSQQTCGWETTYYSNRSLTVIHEVCHDKDRTRSWVRILKVAKGRRPNLYKE